MNLNMYFIKLKYDFNVYIYVKYIFARQKLKIVLYQIVKVMVV